MASPLITADRVWVHCSSPERFPGNFSPGNFSKGNFSEGAKTILENISLNLMPGKITTLIGPNGAGKTTLLKVLLNLMPISAGALTRKAGLKTGYMPQKLTLNPVLPLTVEGLLGLCAPSRFAKACSLIDNSLREVGAYALKNQYLSVLSGGETQRVMLARALMNSPDLLVLDEPMQGVDVLGTGGALQADCPHPRPARVCHFTGFP